MSSLIHSSNYKPRIFPYNGDGSPAEIDRAQSIDPSISLNREQIDEIGRDGKVGNLKQASETSYSLTQLEYGSMEFYKKLANVSDSTQTITLNDFKTSTFDICAYLTNDDGTFKGTVRYPELRVSSFSFSASEPQGAIERSFDLVGENASILQGNNKYYIYEEHEVGSGTDDEIDLSAKEPTKRPDEPEGDNSDYFFRVLRVRDGSTSELTYDDDYTYNETTKKLTVNSVETDDLIKIYYSSSTAPDTLFENNDTDPAAISGESVSIYLYVPASGKPSSSDYIYKLQSADIEASLDREDLFALGNKNVVQRGVTDKTVTVTLSRFYENATVEEVLRGVSSDYGELDISKFTDDASLIIKVFSDNTKNTFKYGLKVDDLSVSDLNLGIDVNEYHQREVTAEAENVTITEDETELGI